jgi:hypothetical protein
LSFLTWKTASVAILSYFSAILHVTVCVIYMRFITFRVLSHGMKSLRKEILNSLWLTIFFRSALCSVTFKGV